MFEQLRQLPRLRGRLWRRHRERPPAPQSVPVPQGGIFGLAQLATHARHMALGHEVSYRRGPERLLGRIDQVERVIRNAYDLTADALRRGYVIAPAAEWLLDNFYLVSDQINLARDHFPPGYSRELPRLLSGPLSDHPRVYAIVQALVQHSDARVDLENLIHFVRAYQEVRPLRLGELWAVPIMLRLTLLENVSRVAARVAWRRQHRNLAVEWAQRFLRVMHRDPRAVILELAEFVRSEPPMSVPFIAELTASLESAQSSLGLVIDWIEQELSERGETVELIQQAESQEQAANQVSVGNSITSLRNLAAIDWRRFVEELSRTEAVLRRDPPGVYARMDFRTRDRYRHVVEDLAKRTRCEEEHVAESALALAVERAASPSVDVRETHVGYFLIDRGRRALEARLRCRMPLEIRLARLLEPYALGIYLAALALLTTFLALPLLAAAWWAMEDRPGWLALLTVATLAALLRPALALINLMVTAVVPPRTLARVDFSEGLPDDQCTAVVMPALLTSAEAARSLVEQIEIIYLANRSPNLYCGLLTDFPDAPAERLEGDDPLCEAAAEGIRALNARYGEPGKPIFFLLHRPRLWNPRERVWMGHERKRGKLEQFNRLVLEGDRSPFSRIEGKVDLLRRVRNVVTLDADTQLPPESVSKMVGTMAHPLNRPVIDPEKRVVVRGYGILQPRLAVGLAAARRSSLARLYAGEVGIDPYTREVSHVYHDLFGKASFAGKGIYDIEAFHRTLDGRFPEDRILSHDLIEGCHARCGFLSDIEVVEETPATFLSEAKRRRRWIRGDWQIARWLWPTVPSANGAARNPLRCLDRWMILDNLRRSLTPFFWVAAFAAGWLLLPGYSAAWTLSLLLLYALPGMARTSQSLLMKPEKAPWHSHLRRTVRNEARAWGIDALELFCLPFHAVSHLHAIGSVIWRLLVTRRHLLEWQTAADAERATAPGPVGTFLAMWSGGALAAILLVALAVQGSMAPPTALVMGLWLLSPAVAWSLSRRPRPPEMALTGAQSLFLRKLARRTWRYFEHFACEAHHWLPPDNYQEAPRAKVARYTSPTNIAMGFTGSLAAYDFGYISAGKLADRVENMIGTMEKLDRHHGHFYNWYSLDTLKPLHPLYVSSVDSGNLSGHLMVLRHGLLECARLPILPARWRQGTQDTALLFAEELDMVLAAFSRGSREAVMLRQARDGIDELVVSLNDVPDELPAIHRALADVLFFFRSRGGMLAGHDGLLFALEGLVHQCEDVQGDLNCLAPWLEDSRIALRAQEGDAECWQQLTTELTRMLTLQDAARLRDRLEPLFEQCARVQEVDAASLQALRDRVATTSRRAAKRIERMEDLASRCEDISDMDLDFLYDRARHLLAIGFNLDARRRDASNYDLLASEARLSSFVGVARGEMPTEHWFHLGRQLAPGNGPPVLVSWSGSLFEYLMPLLIMPTYEGTLLDESHRGAVARQMEYGRQVGVPWGFSESGYNHVDAQMTYQYRAFGVPTLGLKRGLADDVVVAPYAAALALMTHPSEACENLLTMQRMGFMSKFGMYEAVDYTRTRLLPDEEFSIVRSHMAHHSGMTLLALLYTLEDRPMQRRFLADPQFRAATLLLQERIPLARTRMQSGAGIAESLERVQPPEAREAASRHFTTADTYMPEVHLLSNGRYHVMITNAGAGFSAWQTLGLTRWREDLVRDDWGMFFYLRDVESGRTWSPTAQPMRPAFDHYEVSYSQGSAEFRATAEDVEMVLQVAVSPEDDVELRRLTLTNLSDVTRTIELTVYTEVVLTDPRAEAGHPAFQGLFVQSETLTEESSILCTRRPRAANERWPSLFLSLLARGEGHEPPTFETDRARFVGRGRTRARPQAVADGGTLSNSSGSVLDPAMAIRRRVTLRPGEPVEVDAVMGVAPTREAARELIDKYDDYRMGERLFELAWTHSQALLQTIRITEANAQLFAGLANSLLYASQRHRASPSQIVRNRKGQSALWIYGISGDMPIVLVRISDASGLDLARQLIQAHAYWRHKGLRVEMVIWAESYAGYRHNLLDSIVGAVHAGPETRVLDQPGGIFVRDINQVPEEDRQLLLSVARVVVSDRWGTLGEQARRRPRRVVEPPALEPPFTPEGPLPGEMELPYRKLLYFNGLGGFTEDGREYVTLLPSGRSTPAPWVNVLANPQLGTIVSESGSAYTWFQNAHEFRLTPWNNDPVTDPTGEAFYLRDEETGGFWSPTPQPARGPTPYVCRHGLGYTVYEHTQNGIFTEMTVYVAAEAPVKFVFLRIRNLSDRSRRLSVTGYCEWVLGEMRARQAMHVVTRFDAQTGAVLASNAFNYDFPGRVAFFACSQSERTFTGDRTEFIGRNGSMESPAALRREGLSGHMGAGLDPCAAIQAYLDIPPRDERQVVFVLGAAGDEEAARDLVRRFAGISGARQALDETWQFWKHQLGGVYVETPERAVNFLVDYWLLYQALACRFWGRSGFYQSGGAFGFRDQLQDSLAFLYECPWLAREHLLRCASRQFREGDAQHWWHPPTGRGVRTRIADSALWLPYAVCRYVATTGDTGVLDEMASFIEGRPVGPDEESYYDQPQVSDKSATLYEHCVRALQHGLRFGAHGLPLMEAGDWNDGMNRVGHEGKGESVWLAFFLHDALRRFGPLAAQRGDEDFARRCAEEAARLRENIEKHAWDGAWYLRAFFDDGTPLGSSENTECQIDSISQSWAVLSEAAPERRAHQAMDSVMERLVDRRLRLIRLFAPPFDLAPHDPGYIKGYLPGVRENGGQYTHAAVWAVMAVAALREPGRAWELFRMINPIFHGDTPDTEALYKVEPYVAAADVYTATGHEGRGGWTWYTGSAGWMYQLLVERLLGLRLTSETLRLEPLFPPDWTEYTIHYRHRTTFYHIRVLKTGRDSWNVRRVIVDGAEQPDRAIQLVDDHSDHAVTVEAGDEQEDASAGRIAEATDEH